MDGVQKDHLKSTSPGSRCPCRPVQRKSHRKSRTGCQNCKRRKVKCDENKPSCDQCSRCSILCDFTPASAQASTAALLSDGRSGPKKRGRPLKFSAATSPNPASSTNSLHGSIEHTPLKDEHADQHCHSLNVEDMQLFFHYITSTSLTLGDDLLWRDKVPVVAFENPYVLRLILAMSAIHLTRSPDMVPTEIRSYKQLGEKHFSVALREVTGLLPMINSQNCSALYIATVLICNYTFAKPPTADHLLVVADDNEVAWCTLFRGVRFVIESASLENIFSNHLDGSLPSESLTAPCTSTVMPLSQEKSGYIPWERHITHLATLTVSHDESQTHMLEVLREGLADCFREVYGTFEKPESNTNGKTHCVVRWLWILDDEFTHRVKQNDPAALVLLAHFSVILQTLEGYWFMSGWAIHVMNGIVERLDPMYREWIAWPLEHVG